MVDDGRQDYCFSRRVARAAKLSSMRAKCCMFGDSHCNSTDVIDSMHWPGEWRLMAIDR